MNRDARIEYFDMPAELAKAYQYDTRADMTKLRAAGYEAPVLSVESAVRDYVVNYLMPHAHLRG